MQNTVVILGAGISGLTLAWKLAEAGFEVQILEASADVGGLAGTIRNAGYAIDFGPHSFFTEDREIREMVLGLFDPAHKLEGRPRSVKFAFRGKLLDYPLTAASVLSQMGPRSTFAAVRDFIVGKCFQPRKSGTDLEDQSVEDWALKHFGRHLYKSFFKPYTEQFWKMSCNELSACSIPTHTRLNFLNTLRSLLKSPLPENSISQVDRERLPTYYPRTGYGEISEKILSRFLSAGGKICFSSRVTRIESEEAGKACVVFLHEGCEMKVESKYVISTLPLSHFVSMIRPALSTEILRAGEQLRFRPLLTLAMVTQRKDVLGADYIYMLNRPYNRIMEADKFSPETSPEGQNIISVEIPCLRDSELWSASKEDLFELCIRSLEADDILKREDVSRTFLLKAANAYPIYRLGYQRNLQKVLDAIKNIKNFHTLGRGGEFIYMDADQCMRRALDLSGKIISKLKKNEISRNLQQEISS